ncbi:MAG TPA: glycosyltransferase family 9 protein [Thermoanaerobaculia bacterium]|nr:glycosyltransferase family 9 protein [Thermoanaerobaculia bacterium]
MNVLVVRLSAMGDAIHALPLAASAAAAGARVGWVVERAFAGVLEGNPSCERIIVADTKAWRSRPLAPSTWSAIARLRAELSGFRADVVLDPQSNWKSAVAARAAGRNVVGFAAPIRREPTSALLSRVHVTPRPEARHAVEENLALLEAAGIPPAVRAPDAAYLLARPTPEADAFVERLPKPYAVFHPGAGRADKAWGEERFAAIASALRERRGLAPVVSWGPGDEDRAARFAALVPGAARLPRLDVPGLARVAAGARLFAAGDTGPLHLADALGTRTLALFGPTDPERNGPFRYRNGIVRDMRRVSDDTVFEIASRLADG